MPIDVFNPLRYMNQDKYEKFWINLFNTILYGFWSRFFFVILMLAGFWFGVRQRNPTMAVICLVLAALIAYGGGMIDMFMQLSR